MPNLLHGYAALPALSIFFVLTSGLSRAQVDTSVEAPTNAFYLWNNDADSDRGLYVAVLSAAHGIAPVQTHVREQAACEFARNDFDTLYCLTTSNSFYSYNTTTGNETLINSGGSDPGAGFGTWSGMATDPTTGLVYALSADPNAFGALWTIDLSTGFLSFVGFSRPLQSIVFDLSGQLYGMTLNNVDSLYQVDKSTGNTTFVGETGASVPFGAASMDLDEDDGTIYAAGTFHNVVLQEFFDQLMTVNTTTGAFNLFSTIGTGDGIFGPIAIAARNRGLPVELVSFQAVVDHRDVVLTWQTASENNNAGFEIERVPGGANSPDIQSAEWQSMAFVNGHGTTSDPQSYSYRVIDLSPGSYRFRLKQIDFDGTFEYSDVIEVTTEIPNGFVLEAAYPNPFNPATTIRFVVGADMPVSLDVFDALGRPVDRLYDAVAPTGVNQLVSFNAGDLPGGLYFYRLQTPLGSKSRSVMLLK